MCMRTRTRMIFALLHIHSGFGTLGPWTWDSTTIQLMAKAELQEQLLATVLRTDRDGDLQINEREANVLILRMKNYEGIEIDEEQVRDALLKTNGSLPALLEIIRDIAEECCGDDDDDGAGAGDEEVNRGDVVGGGHGDEEVGVNPASDLRGSSKKLVKIDDRKFMESFISNSNYSQSFTSLNDSRHSLLGDGSNRHSLLGDTSKRTLMRGTSSS